MSMLNKWNYEGDEICYGDEYSYQKASEFLVDNVEDWGCGTMWAKRYFKNYKGIDGSYCKQVTEIIDLENYTSSVDNILMRQVLEHNHEWRKILENVQKSFKKKFCLIIHTPLVDETTVLSIDPTNDAPNISFKLQDILDYFPDCKVTQEDIKTTFEYGVETILCIER